MIASYWFVRTIFLIPTFLSSAGIFKIWSLKGDGIRNIFIKNMEHFIDTHSASRKCMFNLNVLENKQCTHSILQGLKVMEQWSFASGDIFLLFSFIFLYYYFFFASFRHLNRKKFKEYGHLENALLKQTSKTIASLWVYKIWQSNGGAMWI